MGIKTVVIHKESTLLTSVSQPVWVSIIGYPNGCWYFSLGIDCFFSVLPLRGNCIPFFLVLLDAVTFGLSVSLFIGVTIVGFQIHGLHFFSFLLPKGAPLALAPLLVVLELISYCFRAVSLGVRLFANMMAGHTLVKILSGFAWTMLSVGGILAVASVVPFGVVFALIVLFICCITKRYNNSLFLYIKKRELLYLLVTPINNETDNPKVTAK